MPTTTLVGAESAANKTIGGVPEIYYFDFASKGRGQALRLLWEDAGIAYKDIRFSFEEYPDFKNGELGNLNPLRKIPVVLLNGKPLTQSYAILRRFSRLLGAYDGKTEDEKYFVDLITDLTSDWRTRFVDAFLSSDRDTAMAKYVKDTRPDFLKGVELQLAGNPFVKSGPFAIGSEFTYADIVIYQIAHDEGLTKDGRKGLQDYPHIKALVDATEGRPNVKAFLESDRYYG